MPEKNGIVSFLHIYFSFFFIPVLCSCTQKTAHTRNIQFAPHLSFSPHHHIEKNEAYFCNFDELCESEKTFSLFESIIQNRKKSSLKKIFWFFKKKNGFQTCPFYFCTFCRTFCWLQISLGHILWKPQKLKFVLMDTILL